MLGINQTCVSWPRRISPISISLLPASSFWFVRLIASRTLLIIVSWASITLPRPLLTCFDDMTSFVPMAERHTLVSRQP